MHELSIVSSVVDSVMESLAAYPGARVKEVRLRVGALASVVEDSLQFCYEIATEDTPLEGSRLVVEDPAGDGALRGLRQRMWRLESVQSFRCPRCGEPAGDLRQGRELEIEFVSRLRKARRKVRTYDHPNCRVATREF